MRRIRGIGGVDVEEPGASGVARSVTISIHMISRGTPGREFFAARRLRELPDGGVGNAAFRGWRRILRDNTSGRRMARVVIDRVDKAAADADVEDVIRS